MSAQGAVELTAAAGAAGSAVLVLLLAARPWRGRAHPTHAWGAPLALSAATATGFWLTRGRPSLPPAQTVHWVFYVALAGGALGVLELALAREARVVRGARLLRGAGAVLLPVALLQFQRELHWQRVEGILWTACLALLLYGAWNGLAALEPRSGGAGTLGLALATALAAGSFGLGGGALFAQLAGSLALALGLCALLGLWRRAPGLGRGGVAPFVLLYHALLWIARWLYELTTPSFVLLSLVPFAALLPALVPLLRPRLRAGLALCAPTLLAAAALAAELAVADLSAYG